MKDLNTYYDWKQISFVHGFLFGWISLKAPMTEIAKALSLPEPGMLASVVFPAVVGLGCIAIAGLRNSSLTAVG